MIDWVDVRIKDTFYTFDFRRTKEIKFSALEAAHYTIDRIVEKNPAPYTLYLSGGIDSQAMLYAWLTSKHKFNAVSFLYNNNINEYDLETLKIFCGIHNVDVDYKSFDLLKFLETEHRDFAINYACGSPQITAFMKMVSTCRLGTVLMSGNFIYQGLATNGNYMDLDRNNIGLYHYVKKSKSHFIPFFFLETMELAHSFKTDGLFTTFDDVRKMGVYNLKTKIYQTNGFPVIKQTRKMNGFEELKKMFDVSSKRVPTAKEKISRTNIQGSNRNFDLLYRNKYEAMFSNYKYTILC